MLTKPANQIPKISPLLKLRGASSSLQPSVAVLEQQKLTRVGNEKDESSEIEREGGGQTRDGGRGRELFLFHSVLV